MDPKDVEFLAEIRRYGGYLHTYDSTGDAEQQSLHDYTMTLKGKGLMRLDRVEPCPIPGGNQDATHCYWGVPR